jgi:hypothetical protein
MTQMDMHEDAKNGIAAMNELVDALRDANASQGAVDHLNAMACELIEMRHNVDEVLTRMERDLRSAGA